AYMSGAHFINRSLWKYWAWLNGYNGGPMRQPVNKGAHAQKRQSRAAMVRAGFKLKDESFAGFFVGRNSVLAQQDSLIREIAMAVAPPNKFMVDSYLDWARNESVPIHEDFGIDLLASPTSRTSSSTTGATAARVPRTRHDVPSAFQRRNHAGSLHSLHPGQRALSADGEPAQGLRRHRRRREEGRQPDRIPGPGSAHPSNVRGGDGQEVSHGEDGRIVCAGLERVTSRPLKTVHQINCKLEKESENMQNMVKISFPYRAPTHLNLLHVISGSGAWAKQGLDVNYDFQIKSGDAHRAVESGEIEFVSGNHISTYGHRARGDKWVYIGQTLNSVHPKLVVRPGSGINGIADLRGKKVGTIGHHPGLNDWLLLKQRGLDLDRDDYELVKELKGTITPDYASQLSGEEAEKAKKLTRKPLWTWVRDGDVDAALLLAPAHLFAENAGLKVIDIEPLPMIWYTTISSGLPFVQKHPDIVERFLKGIIEGIHFLQTGPQQ